MKASTRFAFRAIALVLVIVGVASIAHAGAKCPDRFFKKVQVKGVGVPVAIERIAMPFRRPASAIVLVPVTRIR